ncbi:50S ribosomal protein L28 [Cetobacterium sp. SF1]|uniref:50S ribosomal protein L28 n=1 Tax=unclassified Cetobacterium TaxID=2630983 RepID=UPI003CF37B64
MKRCEITGKGMTFGNQISHSHRVTGRTWEPNLQSTKIVINGTPVKVKVCTKALKTLKGATEAEVMQFLKANNANLSARLVKILSK